MDSRAFLYVPKNKIWKSSQPLGINWKQKQEGSYRIYYMAFQHKNY